MKLIIDTRNGISGDICCAGLLGLGAGRESMVKAMQIAGNMIGDISITHDLDEDINRLDITLNTEIPSLTGTLARQYLQRSLDHAKLPPDYRDRAFSILDILCRAEKKVHENDPRLQHMEHHEIDHDRCNQPQAHDQCNQHQVHDQCNQHQVHDHCVPHKHDNRISPDGGAQLHEAQDILVDITGVVCGLMELEIIKVYFLDYVNVGNGTVRFSHGTFHVPVPAVREILTTSGIHWRMSGQYQQEMATPTGVSILAGLNAERIQGLEGFKVVRSSRARGSRPGLPPVEFHLAR